MQAILRIYRKGCPRSERDFWWHLGYGNLSTDVYTVLPLQFNVEANQCKPLNHVELQWEYEHGKPLNLWQAFATIDNSRKWDVEVWKLSNSRGALAAFLPAVVAAIRVEPGICAKFWRVAPPADEPLPVVPYRRPRDPDAAPRPPRAAPVPALRDIPRFPAEGDQLPAGPLARALELAEVAEEDGSEAGWYPSDSEGGEEDGDVAAGGPPPPPPPPPPAPPPPGGDAGAGLPPGPGGGPGHIGVGGGGGDAGGGGGGGGGPRGPGGGGGLGMGPWPVVVLPNGNRFVKSPANDSVGCHCHKHGASCRVNKALSKHPIGYFMAWLAAGEDLEGPDARQRHMQLRLDRAVGGAVDHDKRVAARARAAAMPEMATVFEWEGAAPGVIAEPVRLT